MVLALAAAIQAVFAGGGAFAAGLAVVYAILAALGCLALAFAARCMVVLSTDGGEAPGLSEQDRLRALLHDLLGRHFPNLAMDLIVTADPVWARRAATPASFAE